MARIVYPMEENLPPYVNQFESAGLEAKNRLRLPKGIYRTYQARSEILGLTDRMVYYRASQDTRGEFQDINFVEIWDQEKPEDQGWHQSQVDKQRRVSLTNVVDQMTSTRNLMIVGLTSHIRVYAAADWERISDAGWEKHHRGKHVRLRREHLGITARPSQ